METVGELPRTDHEVGNKGDLPGFPIDHAWPYTKGDYYDVAL